MMANFGSHTGTYTCQRLKGSGFCVNAAALVIDIIHDEQLKLQVFGFSWNTLNAPPLMSGT